MNQSSLMYSQEARRGAELLDNKGPVNWWQDVDKNSLGMGTNCTIRQLFGSYQTGLKQLGLSTYDGPKYGFNIGPIVWLFGLILYPVLTAAWKDEIEERQQKAVAA